MKPDENKRRHIVVCGKSGGSAESVEWDDIQNKPDFAEVATSGDYDDLENKPQLATVATSGSYSDLTDKPTILTQWFGTQAEYDAIAVKDPNVIYNIEGSDNVQADWNQSDSSADDYIKNKPTIPAAQVNADWNANSGVAQILNKPTIPAAQVNSDWNAASGKAQILNKPNLSPVATSGYYDDLYNTPQLSTVATTGSYNSLKNKPTVPDETETLTFTLQGGTTVTMDVYVKPDYAKSYFFVQDLSGNGSNFTIEAMDGDTPSFDVYTSTDQQTWTLLGTVGTFAYFQTPVPANGKLYIKATTDRWGGDEMPYCDAPYAIGGNIMSLLFGDNFENVTTLTSDNYNIIKFGNYQSETNLYDASKLVLPATTLVDHCYSNMFAGCYSLTSAPALPATTLTEGCYENMFEYCTSLTDAPKLPATTLEWNCYSDMFNGCTSLTNAPALPATTLSNYCYSNMFQDCTSLVEAPELPAQTLVESCYQAMFQGCTSLNKMSVYATDISASDCTADWLNNVSATGDFANWGGARYTRDASGIPAGWNEIN